MPRLNALIPLLILGAITHWPLLAQQAKQAVKPETRSVEELQQLATEIMRHDVGTWDCRWEFLDGDENVAGTMTGTNPLNGKSPIAS